MRDPELTVYADEEIIAYPAIDRVLPIGRFRLTAWFTDDIALVNQEIYRTHWYAIVDKQDAHVQLELAVRWFRSSTTAPKHSE